jgi:hypothetical protein
MKSLTLKVALNSKFVGFSLGGSSNGGVPYGFGMGFAVPRLGDSFSSYVNRTYQAMNQLRQYREDSPYSFQLNDYEDNVRHSLRDPVTGRFVSRN